MKKLFSLFLAIFIVFGLCACGGTETADDTKNTAQDTTTATEAVDPNALLAGFCRVTCIPDDPLVHIAGGSSS